MSDLVIGLGRTWTYPFASNCALPESAPRALVPEVHTGRASYRALNVSNSADRSSSPAASQCRLRLPVESVRRTPTLTSWSIACWIAGRVRPVASTATGCEYADVHPAAVRSDVRDAIGDRLAQERVFAIVDAYKLGLSRTAPFLAEVF